MKNITILLFFILMFVTLNIFGQYSGGDGSAANPYQISNLLELEALSDNSQDWDKNFIQTADIDATATASPQWNNGEGFNPIGTSSSNSFSGSYNGQDYTISNLTINKPNTSNIGLFGYVNNGCEIKNLTLSAIDYIGNVSVGGIAGRLEGNASIENCSVSGELGNAFGFDVGGLAGRSENATIINSFSNIEINGNDNVGGLVGQNINSTISDSYSQGSILANEYIGGLVGRNRQGSLITNCYNLSDVEGNRRIGGLVGDNDNSTIQNSYNEGLITSDSDDIGGICGNDRDGTITECFNTGNINGRSSCGGLVGNSLRCTIVDCYNLAQVNGRDNTAGIAGRYRDGSIINSYNEGNVEGREEVGGITGNDRNSILDKCFNKGNVKGDERVGGISGNIQLSTILESYNSGDVSGDFERIGGIAGEFNESSISASYNTGEIEGVIEVGGLVGYSRGNSTIENSYSMGNVDGTNRIGGFVGRLSSSLIDYSYSTGIVSGNSDIGGFIGLIDNGEVNNCFWDTESSGIDTSADGTGKTTTEMQTQSTFTDAGWDFVGETDNGTNDIWQMGDFCNNNQYPILSWQEFIETPLVDVSLNQNTLTVEGENAEYQWIDCADNSPINDATAQSFTPTENGSYAVIVNIDGCIDTSSCTSVNTVSINSVLQQNLNVFPNPSSGIFIVENEHIGQNYAVTDIYGRQIEQGKIKETSMQLHLSQYADGIYFLKLENQNSIKLLKQ